MGSGCGGWCMNEEEERVCRKCGAKLPIEDFYFSGKVRRRVCKFCRRESTRQSYFRVRGKAAPPLRDRDDWPAMPEILKKRYWGVTR